MNACQHLDFEAKVDVGRILPDDADESLPPGAVPVAGFSAEISIRCADCGEQFVFFGAGLPVGMVRDRPAIDPEGTELRCPIRPQSSDPHFGLGLAGFHARVNEGLPGSAN